jgi:DNA-3-methyladenine glycosylase II
MKNVAEWFRAENVTRERFSGREDEDITTELTELNGISDWTAKTFLLLALGREDVFPVGDLAVRRAVEELIGDLTRAEMRDRAEAWAPHRSVATLYLWQHYVDESADIEDVVA